MPLDDTKISIDTDAQSFLRILCTVRFKICVKNITLNYKICASLITYYNLYLSPINYGDCNRFVDQYYDNITAFDNY